jgi:hypothetical protein
MTESDWAACRDPQMMLDLVRERGQASDRKLRLFACACCRLMDRRGNASGLAVVELAEQVADGLLPLADALGQEPAAGCRLIMDCWALDGDPWSRVTRSFAVTAQAWRTLPRAPLLRDLFGVPFRPATLDPAWRTATVVSLAHAAYDDRQLPEGTLDPARLAVLADALEEAGADGPTLGHLRAPGPHVRGCFVIDLLLNRA